MFGLRAGLAVVSLLAASVSLSGIDLAVAADQCLSKDEVATVSRMASVMAIGVAVQRCGGCLGPRCPQTVQHYEARALLKHF